jgi:septin family protein
MGRLAEQHELRRKKQADMYDNARREKVEIEKDSDIMAQKIEQLALEMQKLQADDAMLNRYQEEQINALQGRVHELYGQLRTYHQHLATAMQPAQ